MSQFNLGPQNTDRYEIEYRGNRTIIQEPEGWRSDEKTWTRKFDMGGMIIKQSGGLTFYDNGFLLIRRAVEEDGINADIQIIKSLSDVGDKDSFGSQNFRDTYRQTFDIITYSETPTSCTCKFRESRNQKIFSNRMDKKNDLNRLDDMDGRGLSPLDYKEIIFEGNAKRNLFLESRGKMYIPEGDFKSPSYSVETLSNIFIVVPFIVDYTSHGDLFQTVTEFFNNDNPDIGSMVLFNNDRDRVLKISFTIDIDIRVTGFLSLDLALIPLILKYEEGSLLTNRSIVYSSDIIIVTQTSTNFIISAVDVVVPLGVRESISIVLARHTSGAASGSTSEYRSSTFLKITEDSIFLDTQSKAVLPKELFERHLQVMGLPDVEFKSNIFQRIEAGGVEDGKFSRHALTSGELLRNIPLAVEQPPNAEFEAKLTGSFKQSFESYARLFNLGMGFEYIGLTERLRIEEFSYFFRDVVTIKLDEVVRPKTTFFKDLFFSTLAFGSKDIQYYEEVHGLSAYNRKATYSTPINAVDSEFKKEITYNTDAEGIEIARRNQFRNASQSDSRYDNKNYLISCRSLPSGDLFPKLWNDLDENGDQITEVLPTNIYSPETCTNLEYFTPFIVHRFSSRIRSGLLKNNNSSILYNETQGNPRITVRKNGIDRSVKTPIAVNSLDGSLFEPILL